MLARSGFGATPPFLLRFLLCPVAASGCQRDPDGESDEEKQRGHGCDPPSLLAALPCVLAAALEPLVKSEGYAAGG
jgi:hypothetical protein